MPPNHWNVVTSSTPGTARIFSRYASGIMTPNDTLWRVNRRFADSGVVGGFSSSSSNVFNVLIRKSDMVMLSTVKIVLLRLRTTFLNTRRRYLTASTLALFRHFLNHVAGSGWHYM